MTEVSVVIQIPVNNFFICCDVSLIIDSIPTGITLYFFSTSFLIICIMTLVYTVNHLCYRLSGLLSCWWLLQLI